MVFDAYPHEFEIAGEKYSGQRDLKSDTVFIPYTEEPVVNFGDVIKQKAGSGFTELKVIDLSFEPGGADGIGTKHNHLLTLIVENQTSRTHKTPAAQGNVSIGSIGSIEGPLQIGNHNTQTTNISLSEFVQQVAARNDPEAKNLMLKFFENPTVAAILGSGTSAALGAYFLK